MNWLKRFMIGRYGADQLSMALLGISIFLSILSRILNSWLIAILYIVILVLAIYRMFSKDIGKRYQENNQFLKV